MELHMLTITENIRRRRAAMELLDQARQVRQAYAKPTSIWYGQRQAFESAKKALAAARHQDDVARYAGFRLP
jgi:hypothetical protein